MSEEENTSTELLHFPCEFVIKVFGMSSDEFEVNVLGIIRNHVKELSENSIKNRTSKDGKYLALTITMPVDSREQLDAIYRELSSNPHVLMVL